jgi:hypothetical protein
MFMSGGLTIGDQAGVAVAYPEHFVKVEKACSTNKTGKSGENQFRTGKIINILIAFMIRWQGRFGLWEPVRSETGGPWNTRGYE